MNAFFIYYIDKLKLTHKMMMKIIVKILENKVISTKGYKNKIITIMPCILKKILFYLLCYLKLKCN